ncbi:MAG: glycosyltransferase family 2 protein, partial [Anaerolineales bacterium]|nr:glycosyltransferase family 2 protein [Anaerolineales bacterium]
MNFESYKIVIIIPAYRVERNIEQVLHGLPDYIKHIIVVDDASPDSTADLVTARCASDSRLILIRHVQNQGVGGAMISGFKKALELGAQIVVKIDG